MERLDLGCGLNLEAKTFSNFIGIPDALDVTRKCVSRDACWAEPTNFIGFWTEPQRSANWYAEEIQHQVRLLWHRVDADEPLNTHQKTHFFFDFAHDRRPGRFGGFHSAARKVPGVAICSVAEQDAGVVSEDDSKGADGMHGWAVLRGLTFDMSGSFKRPKGA
jgi:hypothetical protein